MNQPYAWILQTYFHWHELEERGFSREFPTKEDAETYASNNACGSRHTITPLYRDGWRGEQGSALTPVVAILTIFVMGAVLIAQSGLVNALFARFAQVAR